MIRKFRLSNSRSTKKGRGNSNEIGYYVEPNARGISIKTSAKRPYGVLNLTIDPTKFLVPQDSLMYLEEKAKTKFIENLKELVETNTGSIVWPILQFLESSDNVSLLVGTLLVECLKNDSILQATTKNLLLISNIVNYGEKIKVEMFNALKHIYDDITKFGFGDKRVVNSQFYLIYYTHNTVFRFYSLVSLMYFRFRKHLDSYRRYKSLGIMALSAIKYLMFDSSFDSLVLLTSVVQLNLHSLCKWFPQDVSIIVENLIELWENYKNREEQKWLWISGTLDIVYHGGILPRSLYDRYTELLGTWWTETVVYPPVQVLELPSDKNVLGNFDRFHINYDDIMRNMFVHLP